MLAPVSVTLSAGERIIYEGHPSWRAILAFYLKWLIAVVIIAIIAKLIGRSGFEVFVLGVVLLSLAVIVGFIKPVTTTYTITSRRMNIKRWIIRRDIK